MRGQRLQRRDGSVGIAKLAPEAAIPDWASDDRSPVRSVTRTADELSIVAAWDAIPESIPREGPFVALAVEGPLDFGLTGVLASLAAPLATAEIPIFVLSTFDTDWLLVREERFGEAVRALRGAGHTVLAEGGDDDGTSDSRDRRP